MPEGMIRFSVSSQARPQSTSPTNRTLKQGFFTQTAVPQVDLQARRSTRESHKEVEVEQLRDDRPIRLDCSRMSLTRLPALHDIELLSEINFSKNRLFDGEY